MGSSLGSMNLLAMCLGRSISIEEPQLFSHLYFLMLLMRIEIKKKKSIWLIVMLKYYGDIS